VADEGAFSGLAGALGRPSFDVGDNLAASDLAAEQGYRRQRLRRHNRHLHGWGVVCGLRVVPARDTTRPWGVLVCPGYALGPYGDEIIVDCAGLVDVHEWLWARPSGAGIAFIGIRYAEAGQAPRPTLPPGCGCEKSIDPDSRTGEGFRIDVLWSLALEATPPPFDFCRDLPPCPPCPDSPYIVLARITLPADEGDPITASLIDNAMRVTL
jgi:hypothetical protein